MKRNVSIARFKFRCNIISGKIIKEMPGSVASGTHCKKKSALKSFVVLGMGSEGNTPKMENRQLVSPSRKCSSTPVSFGQDLLANNNVTTAEHPPYSPDLPSAVFYLLPRLKSALKGRRFYDDTDLIQNATKELKSFHKFAFRNISNTSTVAGRNVYLHKGTI